MKLIKTRPRFRCDFCSHIAGLKYMTHHEKICWKNPDRFCDNCNNTGEQWVVGDGINEPAYFEPCFYCRQKDESIK